jgi:hypothetical protein
LTDKYIDLKTKATEVLVVEEELKNKISELNDERKKEEEALAETIASYVKERKE